MTAAILAWIAGNRWAVAVACFCALGAFWAVEEARVSAARSDAATARAETAAVKAEAATSARLASEHYRAEEQRRALRQREIADEAEARIAAANADRDAAGAAADQLRSRVAAVVAAGRRAACSPAATASSPPAPDALELLADVLRRADARAGELAAFADSAHIAGRICEHAYRALTN
jgi:hypothetical protein